METKIKAEASVKLTPEQREKLSIVIESWRTRKGLVVASLNDLDDEIHISFRQLPTELGQQIVQIVNDYYKENDE